MQTTAIGPLNNLAGLFRDKPESENLVHSSMDDFLASVEKQSYVVALSACKDPEAALDKRGFGHFIQWLEYKSDDESEYEDVLEQLPSDEIAPDRVADSAQLNAVVADSLTKLSPQQYQVLILRLWQGLSVKETAKVMGISEGSVKTHL